MIVIFIYFLEIKQQDELAYYPFIGDILCLNT